MRRDPTPRTRIVDYYGSASSRRFILFFVAAASSSVVAGSDLSAPTTPYWAAVSEASSFSTAWSMVKLAARCRGGNSLKVSRNWPTTTLPASRM